MAYPRLITRRPKWAYPNPQHVPWCTNVACGYDLHHLYRPIALYAVGDGRAVAVVTEPAAAVGMSVSNFPEGIMAQLNTDFPGWAFTLIEHTPHSQTPYARWISGDTWKHVDADVLAGLIGETP